MLSRQTQPKKIRDLFAKFLTKKLKPIRAAVVCPYTHVSLGGALLAAKQNIIEPILIGEYEKIKKAAEQDGTNIKNIKIIDVGELAAVASAIDLVHNNEANLLIKGSIHTDDFMRPIVRSASGLRTGIRMSHCQLYDIPAYEKLLIITDCALNMFPGVPEKKDIIQNAINIAIELGINCPKVAILSAVENVNASIPTTLDCVKLCKLVDEGEITGGIVEGPLSFDLAVSKRSVEIKSFKTKVGGDADVLVVPNIEVGNILMKTLDYFTGATGLGVVVGAKVPIVLTSRSGDISVRAWSCALARIISKN